MPISGLLAAILGGGFLVATVALSSGGLTYILPLGLIILGIILVTSIPSLFVSIPWYAWLVGILVIIIMLTKRR